MKHITETVKNLIKEEANALSHFADNLPFELTSAIELINKRKGGRVICTGMGKSGHIAKKISATLMSTGTPSAFLHPAEAVHGDLGMVLPNSTLLAFSNSGETQEIIKMLPYFIDNSIPIISILGNADSTLSRVSAVAITYDIKHEACPHNLAPTTSTTLSLAIGDAIAIALMNELQFKPIDFARFHPGGSLGKKLLDNVSKHLKSCPLIHLNDTCMEASKKLIKSNATIGAVVENNCLVGAVTLGDITRTMVNSENLLELVHSFMSSNPQSVPLDTPCSKADKILDEKSIGALIVLDSNSQVIGSYAK